MSKQVKKRQHYVPQFYLRQFAFKVKKDKDHIINHYDKVLNMNRADNVNNVAEEHKFYDVPSKSLQEKYGLVVPKDYDEQELENTFAFFEGEWGAVFRKISEKYNKESNAQPTQFLTDEEKGPLSRFIALQAIRTPAWRNKANKMAQFIAGVDKNLARIFDEFDYDEFNFYFHIHSGVIDRLSNYIRDNFNWIIAYSKKRLITTDNPLAHVVHLKYRSQYAENSWPAPPYFEEYSIALNPHLLLILAQKDKTGFETLFPSSDFGLTNRLHLRYTRHHIINASRKIFYFDNEQLKYVKDMMYRMASRGEDFQDNTKYIVSVP
jgi:hypothetical protein